MTAPPPTDAPVPRRTPTRRARTASLGTLFLTVFLDLLGFGLVIPFLPGMARRLGAGDFVATMPGAVYSVMQFLFIPIWGRLSDRVGRRPVLLWSIAATAVGHGARSAWRRRCCCCWRRARSAASPPRTSRSRRPTSPT